MTNCRPPQLVGTWHLVAYTSTSLQDPADITYPMGKNVRGLLFYTEDGYVGSIIQAGDALAYEGTGTNFEVANVSRKTLSTCGLYYYDPKRLAILHHPQINLNPGWVDAVYVRLAEFIVRDGETILILTPEDPIDIEGGKRLLKLEWKKAPRNDKSQPPANIKVGRIITPH